MPLDILRTRATKGGEGRSIKMKTGKAGARMENLLQTHANALRLAKTRAEKNVIEANFLMKFQEIKNKDVENYATFMSMIKNVRTPKGRRPSEFSDAETIRLPASMARSLVEDSFLVSSKEEKGAER